MAEPAFELFPYSIDRLNSLLSEKSKTPIEVVEQKTISTFFEDYFQELGAQVIVVENGYVDHDFLEDYASYYVKCFPQYDRTCCRLHFFSAAFSTEEFTALICSQESPLTLEALQQGYLGFVVIRPIPETFVGRTCLATYPEDNGRRFYPTVRIYDAHPFGLSLTIGSVAFQEQDTIVAACATSALWSAFQTTGKIFHHPIPSPVEITKAANVTYDVETRTLPNDGLTLAQMAQAIRSVSLEPFLVNVDEPDVLRGTLYGYLRGRVPVVMSVTLVDNSKVPPEVMGLHAVSVLGYGLSTGKSQPMAPTGFLLKASRMDKVYAHDDQIGPFASMRFDASGNFETSWKGGNGVIGSAYAEPLDLLVPLYNKIRIPFGTVHDAVIPFDEFLEDLRTKGIIALPERLEWDIYLILGSDLKSDIRNAALPPEYKLECALERLPRFLWRATANVGDTPILDLLFDATDIEQGQFFVRAVEHEPLVGAILREICKDEAQVSAIKVNRAERIVEWFAHQP